MKHLASLLVIALWLSPNASHAQRLSFATDASAPLDAKADKIIWQQTKGRADFSGHAHITQGPLTMKADAMHLQMGPDGEAQRLVSQGHVVVLSDLNSGGGSGGGVRRATADTATYDLSANQLLLSGNVKISQTGDLSSGEVSSGSLKIDMQTGIARLLGQTNEKPGRARIELK
ncbi:MAG: hypothetical protein HOK33_03510 [Rhodobiaceae bacterium]|jgi:lipopolysaccharide transport protein LptA|nr:hypothetical protein [Rhodobiaceae bacterium]